MDKLMLCPFCSEDDFDLIGLKDHLLSGHCDKFNEVISPKKEKENNSFICKRCGRKLRKKEILPDLVILGWCPQCFTAISNKR